jgi:hypothetical protein
MTRQTMALAAASVMALAAHGQAQEKYTLKLKEVGPGNSYVFKGSESTKSVTKIDDGQGKIDSETKENKGKSFIYTVSASKSGADEKAAMVLRRSYDKAVTTMNDEVTILPLEGKTVLIEKKGDKYLFRFENGEPVPADQAEDLERSYNRGGGFADRDFLPKQPVRLNESWSVDVALYMKGAEGNAAMIYDVPAAKFTAKLTRVYQKGKSQFGIIEFQLDLPVKAGFEVEKGYTLQEGRAVMKGTYDGCIDGSLFAGTVKSTTSFNLRALLDNGGVQQNMAYELSGKMEQSHHDVDKK